MHHSRQKQVTFGAIVLGAVVFVAASVALKKPVIEKWYVWKLQRVRDPEKWSVAQKLQEMGSSVAEEWYLRKLESKVEEESQVAARKLGELKSRRAVQRLIELISLEPRPYLSEALVEIGLRAVPELIEALQDGEAKTHVRLAVAEALRSIDPEAVDDLDETIEELEQMLPFELVRYLLSGPKS